MTPSRKKRIKIAISLAKQLKEMLEKEWNDSDSMEDNSLFGDGHFSVAIVQERLEKRIS